MGGARERMEIRVDLAQIVISETRDTQIIVLRERDGNRALPIVIGLTEALAIDRRIKGVQLQRPLTHDLLGNVIESLAADLEKIVINDLQDHTFYAKLVIRQHGELIEVDSRPSDAIALGVATEVPIYVEDHVLREITQ
jgi:bifunctional DNase/RNase